MSFWSTVMPAGNIPYGKRLIPTLIEEIAQTDPQRVCFSFPLSSELSQGFRDVNFKSFANAINKTAHFIQQEIGRSSMFETIMYIGFPDLRHYIALVALMKTGHKVLFTSHRNSAAGHADLIKRTECTILLHTSGFPVSGILEKCRLETLVMPELDYLLAETPCEPYPYRYSWDEAKDHPCVVVQSSRSSGPPKAVVWPHSVLVTTDMYHLVRPYEGREVLWGSVFGSSRRVFTATPVFHGHGIVASLGRTLFTNSTVVLGPPGQCTTDVFAQVLEHGRIDSAICLGSLLEEVATKPDLLAKVGLLKHIAYVGDHLVKSAGEIIAQHVPLYAMFTSAEALCMVQHATSREDWQYLCLNPVSNGIEFRPSSSNSNLYELVFVHNPDRQPFQSVFKIFPRIDQYATGDLFSKHPGKQHHWKYEGRKEDMIVFRDGYHFNPAIHEAIMSVHPAIQHCIVVGSGMDRPAAVIDLARRMGIDVESPAGNEEALDAIWPIISRVNQAVEPRVRLKREMIIFAKRSKPFVVVGMNVQRSSTAGLYDEELRMTYARAAERGVDEMEID